MYNIKYMAWKDNLKFNYSYMYTVEQDKLLYALFLLFFRIYQTVVLSSIY